VGQNFDEAVVNYRHVHDERDIRDRFIAIGQGKTGQKLRIRVVGELKTVVDHIRARKVGLKVVSTALVINEKGERMTLGALQKRFSAARARAGVPVGDFQFRDLRAKAGTDKTDSSGDIRQAQRQLGHKSLTMTGHYVRKRRGGESRSDAMNAQTQNALLRKTPLFAEKFGVPISIKRPGSKA